MMKLHFSRKQLCIPYALFLLLFVVIPMLLILFYAFTETVDDKIVFSFANFANFFTSTAKLSTLLMSFTIAIISTAICLLIGYPIAYILARSKFRKKNVLLMLFIMPMWINFVLRITALRELLTPVEYASVDAGLPMFTTTYQTELTDALRALGINDAFDEQVADFSPMGESEDGPLYVSQVIHKTYVDVNEEGTRAAAVTSVGMDGASGTPDSPVVNEVILDRPFVYLIVDQQTMTPVFMGVAESIG